jgi:restriction system protein
MGIWEHADTNAAPALELVHTNCAYCGSALREHLTEWPEPQEGTVSIDSIRLCPACGWWLTTRQIQGTILGDDERGPNGERGPYGSLLMASAGVLKNLSLTDIAVPVEEVRAFLTACYERRFEVHPMLMEKTVASVFADLGYSAVVTGRSGDNGIDIVLSGHQDELVGVQVKRFRGRIAVEQIRALAGALLLGGYTRGIFVTTSSFQAGAQRTAARFGGRGKPIELVDAPRFFHALRLAQLNSYSELAAEDLVFSRAPTACIARSFYSCNAATAFFQFDKPRPAPWALAARGESPSLRQAEQHRGCG